MNENASIRTESNYQTSPRVGHMSAIAWLRQPSQSPHSCLLTLDYTPECMLFAMGSLRTMQIGELARQTALSVDSIRVYEKRKLLPTPARSAGRFRLYATDDIKRLLFIRQMHGLGFSLREIRELIDLRTYKVDACESVRDLLRRKLVDVRGKLQELAKLESELVNDLKKCNKELKHRKQHVASACPVLEEVQGK